MLVVELFLDDKCHLAVICYSYDALLNSANFSMFFDDSRQDIMSQLADLLSAFYAIGNS